MPNTHLKTGRTKLSTTVSPATMEFLEKKVALGHATSVAEAVDAAIEKVRLLENRERLAAATTRYFAQLGGRATSEETALGHGLASAACKVNFDEEL